MKGLLTNILFTTALLFSFNAMSQTAIFKEVGSRGRYTTVGPFAKFDPKHESVEIWTPTGLQKAPIIVYAHGGAGYQEDDRARVQMFRSNGYATISFDAYKMNGMDWEFVTRRATNSGKQNLIWHVFQGALEHALKNREDRWDHQNIFLYGASNGGRIVLYAGAEVKSKNIRGIISEAPAGSGYVLGDYDVPTIIPFGALDTWAGKSDTDFVWKRTYPSSPISIEMWVRSLQQKDRPVEFIFYKNAGHLLFEGPLKKVTVRRGDKISFTAFQGAGDGVLEQYEKDLIQFIKTHISK